MSDNFNVTATLNNDGTISCTWSSVANLDHYLVRLVLVADSSVLHDEVTTATSCVSRNKVIPGGVYRITVWAKGKGGSLLGSKEIKLTVPADFYARNLTVPTNIKATVGTTSISLTFSSVTGALSYDILFDGRVYNTKRTNYTFTGLAPNSTHTYAVRAKNSNVTGQYSPTQTVTTKQVIPGVPAGITKKSTDTSVTISWNPVPNATGYDLIFNGSTYSLTGSSQTFSGLGSNVAFRFRIRAKNANGTSAYSTEQTVTTAPKPPTNISATSTKNAVTIKWNMVAGAGLYTVNFNNRNHVVSGGTTSLTIDKLNSNTTYNYKICCNNSDGAGSFSFVQSIKTQAASSPQLPQVPSGTTKRSTDSSAVIGWSAVSGATGYDLRFNGTVYSLTGTSKEITGLSANTGYKYQVRAKNSQGTSQYSTEQTVTTAPKAPTSISATAAPKSVTINWGSVAGATGYGIIFNGKDYNAGSGSTSLTVSSLQPKTTYRYKICCKNADGISAYSTERQVTTLAQVPAMPSGITKKSTDTSVTISWNAISNAASYDLMFGGRVYNVTTTSKTFTGLNANTGYKYRVRAKNSYGLSAYSAEQTVTTAPKAPTSISAVSTENTVTVSWNNVTGATGYILNINNRDYHIGAGVTSYTVSGLNPKTTYSYKMCCKNADGAGAYGTSRSIKTQAVLPAVPTGIHQTATDNSVTISWNTTANATGYDLKFNRRIYSQTANSKTITSLGSNTGYKYQVRAKNSDGAGAYSTEQTVTTAPKAPTSISAVSTADTVTVSWNNVTGATGYILNINNKDYHTGAGVTSYTVSGLNPKTTYSYKMCCKNADGAGAYGSSRSIKTQAVLPVVPTGIRQTATDNSVTISWNTTPNATGYDLKFDGRVYSQTTNSRTLTGLTGGRKYKYQVRGKNADGAGTYSAEQTVTTAPQSPSGIRTTSTANAVTISWNRMTEATGYIVHFNNKDYNVNGNNNTSLTVSGLQQNTVYRYKVCSKGVDGIGSYCYERSVSTQSLTPAVPSGITKKSSDNSVTIGWNAISNAMGYDLVFNGNTYSQSSPGRTFTGLNANTGYRFKVRAKNAYGAGNYSPERIVTTAPKAPANITSKNSDTEVELKWDAVSGATGYELNFNGAISNETGTSKKVTGLKPNTKYPYKVRAKNADGSSAYSPEKTAHTAPKSPSGLKASTDEDSMDLSWDSSDGADGYDVDVDGKKYSASGNSHKVGGLSPNTDHDVSVSARNAGGSSKPSASKKVRTTPKAPSSPHASASKKKIAISWPAVDGAESYDVLFDGTPHRTTDTSMEIEGLTPGTEHTYTVRCNNADGSSRYGTEQKIKTYPEPQYKKETSIPPRRPKKKYPGGRQAHTELDPVNVVTGAFMWQHTWLARNGRDNLEFVPMYESQRSGRYEKMGKKWTHSFNYMLYADDTYIYFETPDGSIISFYKAGEHQYCLAEGMKSTYSLGCDENSDYYVTDIDGTEYHFDHSSQLVSIKEDGLTEYRVRTDTDGKILEIAGRHGEKLVFTYQNGYITKVADETGNEISLLYKDRCLVAIRNAAGESISFTYDNSGNILTISDFTGAGYLVNTYDEKQRIVRQTMTGRVENRVVYDEEAQETYFYTGDRYFTRYTYDMDGNITDIRNSKTGIHNRFDDSGRIIEQTDVFGNVTNMEYDSRGRMTKIMYPDSTEEAVSYNENNQPLSVKNRDNTEAHYTYDDRNNLTSTTDENGNISSYEYDDHDNLTAYTDRNGSLWTYTYDEKNHLQEASDCLGNKYQYVHDDAGRLTSYTSPAGHTIEYTYSKDGDLLRVSDADGEILYSYDANGSCTSVTDRMGGTQQFAYNEAGQLVSVTDAMGNVRTFTYDDEGNLATEQDAMEYRTSYQYNQWGSVTSYTDKNGNTTSYTFDDADRLTVIRNAAGGEISYAYDVMGQVTGVTDEKGRLTAYRYDNAGNVTKVTDALGNTVEYTYDGNGNILSMTDEEGIVTTYSYDKEDRLLSITREEETVKFAYDVLGRLASVEDSCGNTETAGYDADGNVISHEDKETNRTTYTYDSAGRILEEKAPNEAVTKYTYDKNGNCLTVEDALGNVTAYEYDANNRVTKVTDAAGGAVIYEYDGRGMLSSVTDACGGRTVYEYDGNGNLTKETNAAGGIRQYTYDSLDRLTGITDEEGHSSSCVYDAAGNVTRYTDANGNIWTYAYDSLDRLTEAAAENGAGVSMEYMASGRLAAVTDQEGVRTEYTYDNRGRLTGISDADGNSMAYTYDSMGRVLTQTDANENTTSCEYSPNGNLTKLTLAEGETIEYTYNALGQVETVRDALGNITAYTHDAIGQVTAVTDAMGKSTTFTYTADGRIATVTDALGNSTAYAYDGNGNLTEVTDALGNRTAFEYDAINNCIREYRGAGEEKECITLYQYDKRSCMIKEINPLLEETSYSYDGNGNMTEIVDGEQNRTVVTYDLNNLPTRIQYGTDMETRFRYNSRGQLVEMQDWTGTTSFTRDTPGRLTKVKDPQGREISYEYDAMGRRTGIVYPDGSRAAFAFDKNDRLKKITDAAMQSISYTYDGAGNLAKAVQPGNTVSYTYDKNNRPVAVERLFGVDTRASEQITYDALGRIKTHTGTSSIPEYAFSRSYTYDALGRLASYSDGENTENYLYDALGNRTEKQTDGKTAAAYQYNAMNQLTAMTQGEETYSYLYDRRGNLTEERLGEQVLKSYAYNATNRMISGKNLVSGTKSEYTYNGLLARVRKTSGAAVSSYIPDYPGGIYNDLVTQTAGTGTVNAVYGQGYGRVSQRFMPEAGTGAADTYFQHDLYGSTLFAVDAQGVVRHHASHDIWGMPETICDDISVASGLRFTTYDYDAVLGKHFAHARMYDPSQGRMLGADPVKRGLNGYAYCDNDPVNQTDPTGEVANILLGGIAGGIIGGAFGFAGSALSQIAAGNGFSARKAWGAAANGAIVGAARGALIGSGAGIPLAFGVDFAAGMAGSLAEQKIAGGRLSPVRAAVDGAFNAAGGRLYGTSPLRNAKDAFMRGALEGALKGGAYNIADVLDNKLRNAYGSGGRRNPGTTGIRNPWNQDNRNPWNSRNPRPTGSRCPQSDCIRPKPLRGMRNPKRRGSDTNGNGNTAHRNDRFSLGSFVRDVVSGAVMGGLASVAFYGAGKAVEALKRRTLGINGRRALTLVLGSYDDQAIVDAMKYAEPTSEEVFNVFGHGNSKSIRYKNELLRPVQVAVLIKHSSLYIGGKQKVKLYACETGKDKDGFAQQLANILGVIVEAPPALLAPNKEGEFKIFDKEYNTYDWITFKPQKYK